MIDSRITILGKSLFQNTCTCNIKSGMLQMQFAICGITSPEPYDCLYEDNRLVEGNHAKTSVCTANIVIYS
jgi:hypothetical protein